MAYLNDFINTMTAYNFVVANIQENNNSFSRVERLMEEKCELQHQVLYIGTVSQINRIYLNVENYLFLLINDLKQTNSNFFRKNTVILSGIAQDVEQLFIRCTQWLEEYYLFLERSNLLLKNFCLCCDTMSIQIFVEEIASTIKNPILIFDANFKLLFSSKTYQIEELLWQQCIIRGYCTYEQIIEIQNILNSSERSSSLFVPQSALYEGRLCLLQLSHNCAKMGMLVVFEVNTPFSKIDKRILETISSLTSLVIYNYYEKNKMLNEYTEDNIFIECLSGDYKTYAAFNERIRNTIFCERSNYRVIIIDIRNFKNFDPHKEILKSYFNQIFHKSWMLWYNGNVVAVVNLQSVDNIQDILDNGIDFFLDKKLRFGISDIFDNVYYVKKYYLQGLRALELSANDSTPPMFAYYNYYKFYDLISYASNHDIDLYNFIDNTFLEILKHDQHFESEYLKTILCYLNTDKNVVKTAEMLHIHKNTLLYRLRKIKEIFNVPTNNSIISFQLLYSSYVYNFVNKYRPGK